MPLKFLKVFSILLFSTVVLLPAQSKRNLVVIPKQVSEQSQWVDSVYASLSIEQRIGQLFMVAAYSGGEKYNLPLIQKLIKENSIGGLIYMQGTPTAQAEQTNGNQAISRVPLLIGMDAEWGLGMRLTGIRDMPRQLMLGAMHDSILIYKMASAIADQCRRLGVHVDFAPVVDINNNPNNPVINFRSFGENKNKVANFGIQYMRGLQDNGVIACAKHFPGHGDTDVDSHKDLPEIKKTLAELENMELYPFQKLIDNGLQSMMIAHLQIPALDNSEHTPTTLSNKVIGNLLKGKMKFNGLIFTDALNMQGIAKYYEPGEIDLKAFKAGNDVLLFSQDVPTGVQKIKDAILTDCTLEERLEESVRKILNAKFSVGLNKFKNIDTNSIDEDLNQYISSLRKQIAEASITLLHDPYNCIDKIKRNGDKGIAYVGIGSTNDNAFSTGLKNAGIKDIHFAPVDNVKLMKNYAKHYKKNDVVIVGIHKMTGYPTSNFGLSKNEIDLIQDFVENRNAMIVVFGNPYAVKNFCDADGLLVCYDESEETQVAAAKIVTGLLKPKGKLPVSVCTQYKAGDGLVSLTTVLGEVMDSTKFSKQNKDIEPSTYIPKSLQDKDMPLECCVSPNALGINIKDLDKLDDLLQNGVDNGAFPGCRVLVAKQGKVFYDKAFGYLTQDKRNMVDINTIYDIASCTKVAATTMAIMRLYEQGKIDLNAPLGRYLTLTKGSDKEFLKIKDLLMHQAGLKSWIPFYKETLDSNQNPRTDIYSSSLRGKFSIPVANNLYMRSDWIDTMWKRILLSPLENMGKYVYSDLDFIFLQKVVESIAHKPLNDFVFEEFYKPLGMNNTAYLPKRNLIGKEIAPSERDDYFRHQVIQGDVHDMGAAMFGGVSGHAGLFSTPNDLGILFQMLLNGGTYKGKRYLQQATITLFTSKNSFISRRGLGFDKPEPSAGKGSPCADNVSLRTFGHQGFTGTCIWADPENDLLFIFLSNRTYPSANNKLINSMNIRERAQECVYKALGIASRYRK